MTKPKDMSFYQNISNVQNALKELIDRLAESPEKKKELTLLAFREGYPPPVKGILHELSKSTIAPAAEDTELMNDLYFFYG